MAKKQANRKFAKGATVRITRSGHELARGTVEFIGEVDHLLVRDAKKVLWSTRDWCVEAV